MGPLLHAKKLCLQNFSVSPSPLWVNLGFELGWTGLGLGIRGTRVWDKGLTISSKSDVQTAADSGSAGLRERVCLSAPLAPQIMISAWERRLSGLTASEDLISYRHLF